jgi:hypothetical protein
MLTVTLTTAALLATGVAWTAQETDPARQIGEYWHAQEVQREQRQARLDELMSTMATEMQSIRNASSDKERRALMAAHRSSMHEALTLIREIGGLHLQDVLSDHVGAGAKHVAHAQPREHMSDSARLADLENRLDMIQILLESILEEQAKY